MLHKNDEKHLTLIKVGNGLPEKMKMQSFNAYLASSLSQTSGARFVVHYTSDTPEEQRNYWKGQAKQFGLNYIELRAPDDHELILGIAIFRMEAIPNRKPVLKKKLTKFRELVRKKNKETRVTSLPFPDKVTYTNGYTLVGKAVVTVGVFGLLGFFIAAGMDAYLHPHLYFGAGDPLTNVYNALVGK